MLEPTWKALPAGYKPKSERMLDRAGHLDRKRTIIRECLPEYQAGPSRRVLDLSCGNGVFLELMRSYGHEIMGVDIQYFEFLDSQGVPYVAHDCREMPYPFEDASYDLVSCMGAISGYSEDWRPVLAEFFRIATATVFLVCNSGEPLQRNRSQVAQFRPEGWKLQQTHNIFVWRRA